MQSCWMETPLMRPTFEDIRNRIKYLLRTFKVCVADILLTGTVSASNNRTITRLLEGILFICGPSSIICARAERGCK